MRSIRPWLTIAARLCFVGVASAQTTKGTISGHVVDTQGRVSDADGAGRVHTALRRGATALVARGADDPQRADFEIVARQQPGGGDSPPDLRLQPLRVGRFDQSDGRGSFPEKSRPPAARPRRVGALGVGQAEFIMAHADLEAPRNRHRHAGRRACRHDRGRCWRDRFRARVCRLVLFDSGRLRRARHRRARGFRRAIASRLRWHSAARWRGDDSGLPDRGGDRTSIRRGRRDRLHHVRRKLHRLRLEPPASSAPGPEGPRGNVSAATTNATAARASVRTCFGRCIRGAGRCAICGASVRTTGSTTGGSVLAAAATSDLSGAAGGCGDGGNADSSRSDGDAFVLFMVGLVRCRFFGALVFERATVAGPASADTSNVQRTRGPVRTGGILIACFGTQTGGAIHLPVGFRREFADRRTRSYRTVSPLATLRAAARHRIS